MAKKDTEQVNDNMQLGPKIVVVGVGGDFYNTH